MGGAAILSFGDLADRHRLLVVVRSEDEDIGHLSGIPRLRGNLVIHYEVARSGIVGRSWPRPAVREAAGHGRDLPRSGRSHSTRPSSRPSGSWRRTRKPRRGPSPVCHTVKQRFFLHVYSEHRVGPGLCNELHVAFQGWRASIGTPSRIGDCFATAAVIDFSIAVVPVCSITSLMRICSSPEGSVRK